MDRGWALRVSVGRHLLGRAFNGFGETFARFGTRLDEETRRTLERGRRVREILKQPQYKPLSVVEQIANLVAVNGGVFDDTPLADVATMEQTICRAMRERLPDMSERTESGEKLTPEDQEAILRVAREACTASLQPAKVD